MPRDFQILIEADGDWFVGYCPEVQGTNGQGRTIEDCRQNLREAIELILEDRMTDALRSAPPEAIQESLTVA